MSHVTLCISVAFLSTQIMTFFLSPYASSPPTYSSLSHNPPHHPQNLYPLPPYLPPLSLLLPFYFLYSLPPSFSPYLLFSLYFFLSTSISHCVSSLPSFLYFFSFLRRANLLVPGFGRFKHTFKASVEEFFSPKLLPVLSFSFLLVALSLAVTGEKKERSVFCLSACMRSSLSLP